jgi:hypothetical protein
MSRLRLTALVVLAVATTACVTSIQDLSTGAVAVRTAPAIGQLPERPVLSVTLRTHTDLSRLPKDELIHAETFFCDSPREFALLGRTIYVDPPHTIGDSVAKPDSSGTYNYLVLLEVRRRGSPNSWPVEAGFDLTVAPQTVCIKLKGGYLGMSASSNTVQIPAQSIRDAFGMKCLRLTPVKLRVAQPHC